jgi:nitroimidazol reductase NimA-like FMN-containing flavoprotein (pyridoxamine 5'-phosphate oxidase superfamily)
MDRETEAFILDLLHRHNIVTLATIREDGWPQATTVGYVNDGLTLYVGCGAQSQKARNIERCNKVSLTVDHDEEDWGKIRGSRWAPPPRSSLIRRRSLILAS